MSMPMSISIGQLTAILEGSFPNFNSTSKEKRIHYSLLIDMFRKAEMRVKRKRFSQEGEDFRMRVTRARCG